MNSSQVNFYMTASDQEELEQLLRAKFSFQIIRSKTESDDICYLETGAITNMGHEDLQIYLIQLNMIETVVILDLPNQAYKVFDDLKSPIIQFSRCYRANGVFGRGRLYFNSAYYEGNILVKKDDSFVKWASSILRFTRRQLTKEKNSFFYYGKEAAFIKENGTERFSEI